jgi:hypothetical protein
MVEKNQKLPKTKISLLENLAFSYLHFQDTKNTVFLINEFSCPN